MFPLGSNISVATNLHWNRQDGSSPMIVDLTALYRMQRNNFLPYLSTYHPYNNFSLASYPNYFHFRHCFRTHHMIDPYSTFDYYKCLDVKYLHASLFGKYSIYYSKFITQHFVFICKLYFTALASASNISSYFIHKIINSVFSIVSLIMKIIARNYTIYCSSVTLSSILFY